MTSEQIVQQSEPVENFLKAVYTLQHRDGARVSTNTLSETLSITAPSVTDMAQRLVAAGWIDYKKYHGVLLTQSGEELALRIIRRHRLIELYLVRELGYALHEVHNEAERLEHAVSDRFVEAVAHKLGDPVFDPHGDPIPTLDGTLHHRDLTSLTELNEGERGIVSQLKAENPAMLQFILNKGFHLNAEIHFITRDPFDGPVTVIVDGQTRIIGANVAACIFIERT